ncbi:DUF3267 domain-containing protein [Natrialba aegyptia]|uniref:DUF3267 domain-containing protein n=1 Tax=Natrialba aegyptia DSM 13077 TaxID=1227491 RepID=M0BE38_9EURY|nr:hypothetical protein C480_03634 [Natrialba aegyptia DSM 13077]
MFRVRESESESRSAGRWQSPRLLAAFRLTRLVALQWLVVAVVGFFAFAYCGVRLAAALQGRHLERIAVPAVPPETAVLWGGLAFVILALVVGLHECFHGVAMARYGSDPSYGIGVSYFVLPYAYTEVERARYTRAQMLVVLLAPVVGITVLGLALVALIPKLSAVVLVALAANGAGSIGDLWMAGVLLQYPAGVRVDALPNSTVQGFGVYGPPDESIARRSASEVLSRIAAGAIATLALFGALAIVLALASLAVGSGTVELGPVAGRWVLFRHEVDATGTAWIEIGEWPVLGLAITGGLLWAGFGAVRARFRNY